MRGLNAIYDVPNRQGLLHYTRALFLTFSLVGLAVVTIACVVLIPIVVAFVPLGVWYGTVLDVARWAIAVAVLMAGFSAIYRLGPNRTSRPSRWVTPGAIFCHDLLGWGFGWVFDLFDELWGLQRSLWIDRGRHCDADVVVHQCMVGVVGWGIKRRNRSAV